MHWLYLIPLALGLSAVLGALLALRIVKRAKLPAEMIPGFVEAARRYQYRPRNQGKTMMFDELREQVERSSGKLGMYAVPKGMKFQAIPHSKPGQIIKFDNFEDAQRYFGDPLNFVHPKPRKMSALMADFWTGEKGADALIDEYLATIRCQSCRGEGCPDCGGK